MNLEAYQEFLTLIRGMNLAIEQGMINTLLDRTPTGKSLPYDKIKNPQEFQHNKNRIIMNLKQSEEWMNTCKPYEVEEKIQKICSVIKIPPQQKKQAFLPRNPMFIDVIFDEKDYDIKDKKIIGILLGERPMVEVRSHIQAGNTIGAYMIVEDQQGQIFLDSISINPKIIPKYQDRKIKQTKLPTTNFIENFVCNLLNFINHKEIIFIKHTRSQKGNQRRIQKGKIPLPESEEIKVTGLLKKYIDKCSEQGGGWHYSFRFPVSAHERHYKNGKVTKIKQYDKGQGIYIDKKRIIVADKQHPDVQRYDEENLDYSDIEPLDEPLRNKKAKGEI